MGSVPAVCGVAGRQTWRQDHDVIVGKAGSWLVGTCLLPWLVNTVPGGRLGEPWSWRKQEAAQRASTFALDLWSLWLPEMKLSEILVPNARTVGQVGRGIGVGVCPGGCHIRAVVKGLRTPQRLELICRKRQATASSVDVPLGVVYSVEQVQTD